MVAGEIGSLIQDVESLLRQNFLLDHLNRIVGDLFVGLLGE